MNLVRIPILFHVSFSVAVNIQELVVIYSSVPRPDDVGSGMIIGNVYIV